MIGKGYCSQLILGAIAYLGNMQAPIPTFLPKDFLSQLKVEKAFFEHFERDYLHFFVVPFANLIKATATSFLPFRTPNHSLFYVHEGHTQLDVGFKRLQLEGPCLLLIPGGQVVAHPSREPAEGWVCLFSTDFLMQRLVGEVQAAPLAILDHWTYTLWQLSEQEDAHVHALLRYVFQCYHTHTPICRSIASGYLMSLLCEVQLRQAPTIAQLPSAAVRLTQAFKELLKQHLKEHRSVQDYAALLHVTPNHLHKVVKAATQRTPSQWMDELLLIEAKLLLLHSGWSIGRLAAELGWSDPAYFSRWFKKQTTYTPSHYREQMDRTIP